MPLDASFNEEHRRRRDRAPLDEGESIPTVDALLADAAASSWIKSALQSALTRDPVDALNDALVLAAALETHLREVLGVDK